MRRLTISPKLLENFRRSAALQRIAADEKRLRLVVKNDPRKIIPVAAIARWLQVSNRQMWNWIEQGWISTYQRPSESYKKGISKTALSRFLNRVREQDRATMGLLSPVPRGRPPMARKRLYEAYYRTQVVTNGMTPKECAAVLGISADSVRRALQGGFVSSFLPSDHRYRVGCRARISKRR